MTPKEASDKLEEAHNTVATIAEVVANNARLLANETSYLVDKEEMDELIEAVKEWRKASGNFMDALKREKS